MKNSRRCFNLFFTAVFITILGSCPTALAAKKKKKKAEFSGKLVLDSGADEQTKSNYAFVTQDPTTGAIIKTPINSSGKFTLSKPTNASTSSLAVSTTNADFTPPTLPISSIAKAIKGAVSLATEVYFGPLILAIKDGSKMYTFEAAQKKKICSKSSVRAVLGFDLSKALTGGKVKVNSSLGIAYLTEAPSKALLALSQTSSVTSTCVPPGAFGTLGQPSVGSSGSLQNISVRATSDDADGDGTNNTEDTDDDDDGILDVFDVDNDNDFILDNDDQDNNDKIGAGASQFYLFSNLHLAFLDSINANAATITKAQIDAALAGNAGLAIQVVTVDSGSTVELDCGNLSYCSTGGTGRAREPYPDGTKFPEGADTDGDGKGTLTAGGTGDFQLGTFATSDEIKAGDIFIQEVTDSNATVTKYPGMLSFIFHTVPAVKTLVTGSQTYDVSYPIQAGAPGTNGNCFELPATGDATVTITAWRPQRPGNQAAGEAELVDMGNLRLITNIPNAPCVADSNGQCLSGGGSGPGLCSGSSSVYPSFDSNLTLVGDGLRDTLGDQAVDPSHTFTYTINLTTCFAQSGITFDAGESFTLSLQMMNEYGDNAAQQFCLKRADS